MTDPVQEPDAARERERLAGREAVALWAESIGCDRVAERARKGEYDQRQDVLWASRGAAAALRASEPVPGAVGVSVEDIDRTLRELGAIDLANYQHRRVVSNALLILVTPRTVEPDPASGADWVREELKDWWKKVCTVGDISGIVASVAGDELVQIVVAMVAARPSSPRDAGEAETVEQLRRARDVTRGLLGDLARVRREKAILERQIAGAVEALRPFAELEIDPVRSTAWMYYQSGGKGFTHDDVRAATTFLASLKETSRGE